MSVITSKDVEIVVSSALGPNVEIVNYRLEPYSKQNNGLLGNHCLLTVDVKEKSTSKNEAKSHTYFVKTPPESPLIQDLLFDASMIHQEMYFFKTVHPHMLKNYKGEKWSPLCYIAEPGLLIFEDIRAQGYVLRSEMLIDEESLKSALSALARFHASTVLTECQLAKTLKEAYPNAFQEQMFTNQNKFGKTNDLGFKTIALMADKFGLDSSIVPEIKKRVFRDIKTVEGGCNVLSHGDLWKNNLMFNSSTPPKCIIVDYQFLRYTSPAADIGMLLHLNSTPEFRKKSEVAMFKHYYSEFRNIIVQNNSEAKIPSYENMLKDYQDRRLIGMVYSCLYLPGICLSPEILADLLNNPEVTEIWFLHNRIDLIQSNLESDPVYRKRMKAIVSELLEEGKRLLGT